jgi:hypothetical protein
MTFEPMDTATAKESRTFDEQKTCRTIATRQHGRLSRDLADEDTANCSSSVCTGNVPVTLD